MYLRWGLFLQPNIFIIVTIANDFAFTVVTVSSVIQHTFLYITIITINTIFVGIRAFLSLSIIMNRIMKIFKQFHINIHLPPKLALLPPPTCLVAVLGCLYYWPLLNPAWHPKVSLLLVVLRHYFIETQRLLSILLRLSLSITVKYFDSSILTAFAQTLCRWWWKFCSITLPWILNDKSCLCFWALLQVSVVIVPKCSSLPILIPPASLHLQHIHKHGITSVWVDCTTNSNKSKQNIRDCFVIVVLIMIAPRQIIITPRCTEVIDAHWSVTHNLNYRPLYKMCVQEYLQNVFYIMCVWHKLLKKMYYI